MLTTITASFAERNGSRTLCLLYFFFFVVMLQQRQQEEKSESPVWVDASADQNGPVLDINSSPVFWSRRGITLPSLYPCRRSHITPALNTRTFIRTAHQGSLNSRRQNLWDDSCSSSSITEVAAATQGNKAAAVILKCVCSSSPLTVVLSLLHIPKSTFMIKLDVAVSFLLWIPEPRSELFFPEIFLKYIFSHLVTRW